MHRIITLITLALLLAGCVYKMDVRQGNQIDPEVVEQITPGMSRSQVRFLLGTPMVADPFHEERWDYVYFYKSGKTGKTLKYRLEVHFDGDVVARVDDKQIKPPQPAT